EEKPLMVIEMAERVPDTDSYAPLPVPSSISICRASRRLTGKVRREWSALKRRHTAVNDKFGTQHESGFGRRQVKYSGGDLLRRAKAFDRDLALKCNPPGTLRQRTDHTTGVQIS